VCVIQVPAEKVSQILKSLNSVYFIFLSAHVDAHEWTPLVHQVHLFEEKG